MARYNADGSLDTLFGTKGRVIHDFTGPVGVDISGIAIQGDGKIIAAGR